MLSDDDINRLQVKAGVMLSDPSEFHRVARLIEQAVLNSREMFNTQCMADCMDMVKQELVEARIIDESVAPMFVANAVMGYIQQHTKMSAKTASDSTNNF